MWDSCSSHKLPCFGVVIPSVLRLVFRPYRKTPRCFSGGIGNEPQEEEGSLGECLENRMPQESILAKSGKRDLGEFNCFCAFAGTGVNRG